MNFEPQDKEWNDEQLDAALAPQLDTVCQALQLARQFAQEEAPTVETLARYLDNSLTESERAALEKHLTDNPKTLASLIQLHRQAKRILNLETVIETVEKHHSSLQVDYEASKTAILQAAQLNALNEISLVENDNVVRPRASSENG